MKTLTGRKSENSQKSGNFSTINESRINEKGNKKISWGKWKWTHNKTCGHAAKAVLRDMFIAKKIHIEREKRSQINNLIYTSRK